MRDMAAGIGAWGLCLLTCVGCATTGDSDGSSSGQAASGSESDAADGDTETRRSRRELEVRGSRAEDRAGKPTGPETEICRRNCRGFEYCLANWRGRREECVRQCRRSKHGPCGDELVAFLRCSLDQTCRSWARSNGGKLAGCESEYEAALECSKRRRRQDSSRSKDASGEGATPDGREKREGAEAP